MYSITSPYASTAFVDKLPLKTNSMIALRFCNFFPYVHDRNNLYAFTYELQFEKSKIFWKPEISLLSRWTRYNPIPSAELQVNKYH